MSLGSIRLDAVSLFPYEESVCSKHPFIRCFSSQSRGHSSKLRMLFEESVHVQDILLQVALGHSLIGSQSVLAALSKDIVQHALATAIEQAYWEMRSQEGLLTPKPAVRASKFCTEIPESIKLPEQAIRRALVVRPVATVPRLFRAHSLFLGICPTVSSRHHHESWSQGPEDAPLPNQEKTALSACSPRQQSSRHSFTRKPPKH